jgi:DNA repair protein RadD
MDKLRDYQEESVEKSLEFLLNPEEKNNGLIILPTGAGKSLVIAYIALLLDSPVLVFQPSKEILEQNYQKLLNDGAFDVSIFSASMNQKRIGNLQTQALSRDLSIFFLSSMSRIRSIHQLIKRLMSRSRWLE